MTIDERLGTLEEVLGGLEEPLRAIALRLRALVFEVDPDTTEQPRPGDASLSYGVGPRKMRDGYAYVMPMRGGYVNLGFYEGTALPDPAGLLEGTGKALRHVKVRDLAGVARPELRALLVAAVARRHAGPK